ncbi:MAG: hypothetical protein ACREX4_20165 [Gammaproteobacteria bacterium]
MMIDKSKTERLLARLEAIYGSRWTACYNSREAVELAIAEWSEVVERMSDAQLATAVSWAKMASPWPPSIAEFLHAGLGIDGDEAHEMAERLLLSWDRQHMTQREMDKAIERRGLLQKAMSKMVAERLSQDRERLGLVEEAL